MKPLEARLLALLGWAEVSLGRLRHEDSPVVADRLGDEVLRVNSQLGVEVGEDVASDCAREVIVTAFSEPRLFPLVHRVAGLLNGIPGWSFVALKPPRGFDFSLALGRCRIEAASLIFSPIAGTGHRLRLGLREGLPGSLPVDEDAEEMAWLIVETGIGEELAGLLEQVELCPGPLLGGRPVSELAAYLGRGGRRLG